MNRQAEGFTVCISDKSLSQDQKDHRTQLRRGQMTPADFTKGCTYIASQHMRRVSQGGAHETRETGLAGDHPPLKTGTGRRDSGPSVGALSSLL